MRDRAVGSLPAPVNSGSVWSCRVGPDSETDGSLLSAENWREGDLADEVVLVAVGERGVRGLAEAAEEADHEGAWSLEHQLST